MKIHLLGLISVFTIGASSLVSPFATAPARAQTAAASPAQVDALIEDIKAHKQMCGKVTSSQTGLARQCANEQAALIARQQKLGVSDETLNAQLKTRGWRWP